MKNNNIAHMKSGEPVIGRVVRCTKLNVRKDPDADAEILGTIPAGAEVMIDESDSTDDFYNVCAASGFEGFCMKQFIEVAE
ncbi:MAG: SH3 domain-containing protein [Muribaculum sp.]|nr:SH3 domain-containing protein [Muribaculum sp.]